MLDYKCLEALAMVVREGGFEKAGRVLNLTQSAVSQRIKSLEDRIGRLVLTRGSPPAPTPDGERLIKHFKQVSRLENDLDRSLDMDDGQDFATLSIGVNADSLATWFMESVDEFLRKERVLLDIAVDDQDVTHEMLRQGRVLGCLSSRAKPMQGCESARLGGMEYRLLASPEFAGTFFPHGVEPSALRRAPALIFNRKDELLDRLLRSALGPGHGAGRRASLKAVPAHYLPSSEQFLAVIARGLAYGALPLLQAASLLESGRLIDIAPGHAVTVNLYWHCWSLDSALLRGFTSRLVAGSRACLA